MALFSTLLSASGEQSAASTSSSIPTLIQLFSSKSLTFDENAKLDSHAVLAYQALEVAPPEEGDAKLFSQRRTNNNNNNNKNKTNNTITPNLGVWNCCIASKSNLVDSLLTIPDSSTTCNYCLTVDLTDPTMVEPALSVLHEALVRLLIQQPPTMSATQQQNDQATTSLAQLKVTQFGLAPEDKPSSSFSSSGTGTNTTAAEDDVNVKLAVMICAIVGPSTKDDYKETQAQNLIFYHLRRYAAAIHATLVLVGGNNSNSKQMLSNSESNTSMSNTDEVPTIPIEDISYSWREWILGNPLPRQDHVFSPANHQPDLIESVLLRNAQYAGEWDASKDSLWKALPPAQATDNDDDNGVGQKAKNAGDDDWLSQLRDSMAPPVGDAAAQANNNNSSTAAVAAAAGAPPKEDAAVSSFFENLLKK
mmetsp:Transcript_25439/g.42312  ORF Transcript_25439/g.42312 Transcript_25439/m.42312 type:complete len:420 (+) Transcript_25439:96-1355(+)|eukprot:CAMPEP_0119009294 /NCGR_PEP_ID=MMETSP1176-20130426/4267_1 /TAXON_ID=265551 /ORGANISM="Synedropsis recta cf, Strain CCMP1620" /LENGTH=419 /DNA_ID=CAMNT_0006961773 /DNA_START=79 /DNA_END=1338 /DNA_ORIENTATION=-